MDLEDKRDVIETPIEGVWDINGWDLRKALRLYRKSNPPVLEWLQSPIVYRRVSAAAADMLVLIPSFYSPSACMYHCLHMAHTNCSSASIANHEEMHKMSYDNDNIFAKILRNELPSARVYEDDHTLAFMDVMPRADGHVLVIPKAPARNMLDATPAQLASCLATVQKISHAQLLAFDALGITLQQFNEAAGGQEVFHLHFHVLPRHAGVRMRAPGGGMADPALLAEHAAKIRAVLVA